MIAAVLRRLSVRVEIALVIALFAGWFILVSVMATLAGFPTPQFSDAGLVEIAIFEVIAFALAFAFLYVRGWRPRDFNIRPSWVDTLVGLLLFGAGVIIFFGLWDLFRPSAPEKTFLAEMKSATTAGLPIVVVFSPINAAYEEFFLTGYLLKALQSAGAVMALGVSALVRLSYHLYQGPLGALSVLAFGLIFTMYYWRYRQLWPVISAHIAWDVTGLT